RSINSQGGMRSRSYCHGMRRGCLAVVTPIASSRRSRATVNSHAAMSSFARSLPRRSTSTRRSAHRQCALWRSCSPQLMPNTKPLSGCLSRDSRIDRGMIQDGKLRGFAMSQAIPVRTNYTAGEVRRFAQRAKDAAQARRLLAIAAVLDGASREEAATIGGMDRQTLGDWVIRFNEQGPDGLINIPSPGVPPKLNSRHKAFLARIVDEGPIPAIHGVVRWRACDLIMRLYEEFGLSVSDDTIYRALKNLG